MATNKVQSSRPSALYEKGASSTETLRKERQPASAAAEHGPVQLHDLDKIEPHSDSKWDLPASEEWSWEAWARRSEENWIRTAKSMETSVWAAMGAMVGIFLGGVPGTMIYGWAFFVWQPLGAAVGAITALAIVRKSQKPYKPSYRIRRQH